MLLEVQMPPADQVTTSGFPILYRVGFKEQVKSIFKNGYNRQFAGTAGGKRYGIGTYCNDNLRDSQKSVGVKEYGDVIFKMYLVGGYYGFIIFNEQKARAIYGNNWRVFDQLKTLYGATNEELNKIKQSCEFYIKRDGGTYHHGRTGPAAHGLANCTDFIRKHQVKGLIYTGLRDGACVVPYDFGSIIPYSVSYDKGKTFKVLFNAEEYERRINNVADVHFKYDRKYKKVFEPTAGFAMVINHQGKYNYVDIKDDTELSPIWFDMINMPLDPDTKEFSFSYKGVSMNATVETIQDNEGGVHKGCILNNGEPYCGFEDLDDLIEYLKTNENTKTYKNKIINEMFSEDHVSFKVPDKDEITNGKMTAIYRAAFSKDLDSIFKNGYNRQFAGKAGGSTYGVGTYCMTTFEAALRNVGPTYGDIVVKMYIVGGFEHFLIYQEELARKVYGHNWRIEDQIVKVLNIPRKEVSSLSSPLSAGRNQDLVKKYGIRGMIYRWGAGYAVNVFDFNSTIPYAVYFPREKKWETRFDYDVYKKRMDNVADVHFKYDAKYKKVFEPTAGFAMVINDRGKYNYVDVRDDKELSPIWFDMIDMPLDPDTKEFSFSYKGVSMSATVETIQDNEGGVHKGCILNDGEPYCGFEDLDDLIEYLKGQQ